MNLYPIFLKLDNTPCLVIGGGTVAERKVENLLNAEAQVTLIAPDATRKLELLATEGKVQYKKRVFQDGDLKGFSIVVAATNSHEVNSRVFREAMNLKVLINSVDDPDNSNFYVPSVVRRGDLQIAVSTSGKVPYFAKRLRGFLERKIYDEIEGDMRELFEIRKNILLEQITDSRKRMRKVSSILDPKIDEIFRKIDER